MRTATIIKAIGNKSLNLYKGKGYWYFIFDDGKVHESHSVYTMRLSDMSLDSWIYEGKAAIATAEKRMK